MHRRQALMAIAGVAGLRASICCSLAQSPPAQSHLTLPQIACGFEPGTSSSFRASQRLISNSTGYPPLDDRLLEARQSLNKFFALNNPKPTLLIYEDEALPFGARAINEHDSTTIYLGRSLVRSELASSDKNQWYPSILGVIAHEWAHALQYWANLYEKTFILETHADLMAGWFIGIMQLDPAAFARSLFLRGDISGIYDENHYGSPQQRVKAMYAGIQLASDQMERFGRPSVRDAATRGYAKVAAIARSFGKIE